MNRLPLWGAIDKELGYTPGWSQDDRHVLAS